MANLITIIRIIIAFIAITLLFFQTPACYITAFILTAIAIWFDGLDGFVARLLNESSKFGAVLDIIGDRIVENIYWIVFAVLGWIPVWIPLIVVTRGWCKKYCVRTRLHGIWFYNNDEDKTRSFPCCIKLFKRFLCRNKSTRFCINDFMQLPVCNNESFLAR